MGGMNLGLSPAGDGTVMVKNSFGIDYLRVNGSGISHTQPGGDVQLTPGVGGRVVLHNQLVIDDLKLDGNVLSATKPNTSLVLQSSNGASVVLQNSATVDNIKLDGNTISSIVGDIELMPSNDSKVRATSPMRVQNLLMDGNRLSSLDGDIKLAPEGSGRVVVGNALVVDALRFDNNSISNENSSAVDQDVEITPSGSGSVVLGNAAVVENLTLSGSTLSNNAGGDVNVRSGSDGRVILGPTVSVDNILVDGNTVSVSDGNLNLQPGEGSKVISKAALAVHDMLFNDTTVHTTNDKNLNLAPSGDGKIVLHSSTLVSNLRLDGNTLSSSLSGNTTENIKLAPAVGGKVVMMHSMVVDNLQMDGNTLSAATGNLNPTGEGSKVMLGSKAKINNLELFQDTIVSRQNSSVRSTTGSSNIVLRPKGSGKVVLHNAVVMDNLLVDGSSIRNTVADSEDQNINLMPPSGGSVIAHNMLKLDKLSVDDGVISVNNVVNSTDENLYLRASAKNGKVVVHDRLQVGSEGGISIDSDSILFGGDTLQINGSTNAEAALVVTKDGRVGFGGQIPNASAAAQFSSGSYISTGGAWHQASRRALKRDIQDLSLEEAVAVVRDLEPVTYRYLANGEFHVGFIAEDVPALVAGNVSQAQSPRKGLSALDFVAVLTKVVQSHEAQLGAYAEGGEHQSRAQMVAELRSAIKSLSALIAKGNATLETSIGSVNNLHYEVSSLQTAFTRQNATLQALTEEVSSHDAAINAMTATIKSLSQELATANDVESEKALAALEAKVARGNVELAQLLEKVEHASKP